MSKHCLGFLLFALLSFAHPGTAYGQSGGHTLYGDVKIDENGFNGLKPMSLEIILYAEAGHLVSRQSVSNNGRYRFMNLPNGRYDLVVEIENNEVARVRVNIDSPFKNDFRQDLLLEWRANPGATLAKKDATVVTEDFYKRSSANENRFVKAREEIDRKNYDHAVLLLREIVTDEPMDFQSWTELGTAYLIQEKTNESEKAYQQATKVRPTFLLALLNLGRLLIRERKFEEAIDVLNQALQIRSQSPDVNYYLGEAYLQVKKGSKAVVYFYEALKLDPVGKAEAHLRLATLYNAAGLKDKAVAEYEEFLKKKPDYPDKMKLEQYIAANKKVSSKQ